MAPGPLIGKPATSGGLALESGMFNYPRAKRAYFGFPGGGRKVQLVHNCIDTLER